MRMVAQRIASVIGLRVPAANGATVKGTRAADMSLQLPGQLGSGGCMMVLVPLKSPVVAPMGGRRLGYGCWVVC